MADSFYAKLRKGCLDLCLNPSDLIMERLCRFYEMLRKKNQVMNLTSITDEDEIIIKHFIDSLSIVIIPDALSLLKLPLKVVDVGTGAGFPGMALKIFFSHLDVTLMDSARKKLDFLDEVIEELGLGGVRTVHGRAESLGRDSNFRENFDLVMARAVAYFPVLAEYCLPFLMIGGRFAAYKSADCKEEIAASHNALSVLGGEISRCEIFLLPGTRIKRSIIMVEKVRATPKEFPRREGIPMKKPL